MLHLLELGELDSWQCREWEPVFTATPSRGCTGDKPDRLRDEFPTILDILDLTIVQT